MSQKNNTFQKKKKIKNVNSQILQMIQKTEGFGYMSEQLVVREIQRLKVWKIA